MGIKELKKELGFSQKDLAEFFRMSYGAFANSSAKERYESAIVKFYEFEHKPKPIYNCEICKTEITENRFRFDVLCHECADNL